MQKKNNIEKIFFVMREGRIFKECLDMLNSKLNTSLLYASRKSTFLPSFDIDQLKNKGFNFYKYKNFTIENFYELFQLEIKI